jgi:hypothetical protein
MRAALAADLRRLLSSSQVLDSPEDRVLYSYDGTGQRGYPEVVVLTRSAADVASVLRYASAPTAFRSCPGVQAPGFREGQCRPGAA